jgi:hypothetical protein
MPNDTDNIDPASESLSLVPRTVVPASEDEVLSMIEEEARFCDSPQLRETAIRLLVAGFTVKTTARRLNLRASTLMLWAKDKEVQAAMARGKEHRQTMVRQRLETAAETAVDALVSLVDDPDVPARDRVKASEAILDRCGLASNPRTDPDHPGLTVDIDFDERLARIVAGSG